MVVFKFLGSTAVSINNSPIADISTKALALLLYLSQTDTPQQRTHVAGLLWSDKPATQSLANLRGILHELKLISEIHHTFLIDAHRKTLQLHPSVRFSIDTRTFQSLLETPATTDSLNQAIQTYQGNFAPDFFLKGNNTFDDWLTFTRTSLNNQYIKALESLATLHSKNNAHDLAIHALQTLTQQEPYREDIHLKLMLQFTHTGQRANAIVQFETCQKILRNELNTTPNNELKSLYQQLISKPTLSPLSATDKEAVAPTYNTGHKFIIGPPITRPHQFFGREFFLQRIFGWWQQPPFGHVALVGKRRSGKTSLLKHLRPISSNTHPRCRDDQTRGRLGNSENYRWIEIDFQDPRMRLRHSVLSHLLKGCGIEAPPQCTLETFMELATESPWQTPTLLLMDELEAGLAAEELDQEFWWSLRALTQMTDGYIGIALAAYESPMQAAHNMNKTSPFFNIFSTLELGPLEITEAMTFIQSIDADFSDSDCQWILEQSNCWPCLLQILCQEKYLAITNQTGDNQWRDNALQQLDHYAYLLQ